MQAPAGKQIWQRSGVRGRGSLEEVRAWLLPGVAKKEGERILAEAAHDPNLGNLPLAGGRSLPPAGPQNRVLTLQCHYIYIFSNATGRTPIRVGFYGACAIREISIEKPSRSRLPSTPMLCIGLSVVMLMPWVWAVSATELTLEG